eukprot:TRINITY_DN10957_c0_g1_i1.p1 TRINITY_DN10957_c0_g1~~TRINITY_DN10957_c0_g1_i1.p1  ORF type:complete len:219 (-),score=53.60 TRINITY_DN10957_c0_g1_i1:208-789(-)
MQKIDQFFGLSVALSQLRHLKKQKHKFAWQLIQFGLIVSSALMIWKTLSIVTGCESPVVVVPTGSMKPLFYPGDLLFLYGSDAPVRVGEILVFLLKEREIPIVHRVIRVHERNPVEEPTKELEFLTKGDNNRVDDRALYPRGQLWLERKHVIGRVWGHFPMIGRVTMVMNDYPLLKYVLIGFLGLMVIIGKEE